MSDNTATITHGKSDGLAQYLVIWAALLVSTGIEVWLAYLSLTPGRMVALLLGLSILKAVLIMAWFMHLKFETARLRWIIFGILAAWLAMFTLFLPDAFRIVHLGVQ